MSSIKAGAIRFVATGDTADTPHGKLTLSVIREQLAEITALRAVEDPYLFYLDGQDL